MKTRILAIAITSGIAATAAQADSWTWTPISNGNTLDAHLARCDFARPNPMDIFSTIAEIQEKMVAPQESATSPRS